MRSHCSPLKGNGHKQVVPRHPSHHQAATDQDDTVTFNRLLLTHVPVESRGQRTKWTVQNQLLDDGFSARRLHNLSKLSQQLNVVAHGIAHPRSFCEGVGKYLGFPSKQKITVKNVGFEKVRLERNGTIFGREFLGVIFEGLKPWKNQGLKFAETCSSSKFR